MAKKLWEARDKCDCCVSYKKWKETHPQLARHLQECADKGKYYQVFSTEKIIVDSCTYKGTIRALSRAPLGACKGVAPEGSPTCESCKALICGKTSTLNRKLHRSKGLKHPRSEDTRATASGVNHSTAQHNTFNLQYKWVRISSEKVSSLMMIVGIATLQLSHSCKPN